MEFLCYRVLNGNILKKLPFSKVVLFYMFTRNVWEFQLLHILFNIWCYQSFYFIVGGFWYLMVLICVALMTNNVKYIFIGLLTMCIYSFIKSSNIFAWFLLGCLPFIDKFQELFIYSGYKLFIKYMHCENFSLVLGLLFISLTSVDPAEIRGASW